MDESLLNMDICSSGLTVVTFKEGFFWLYPDDERIKKLDEIIKELDKLFPNKFAVKDERRLNK